MSGYGKQGQSLSATVSPDTDGGAEWRNAMLLPIFVAIQSVDPAISTDSLLTRPERCLKQSGEEIIVCGRRNGESPYRIGPQPPAPPTLPDAEFSLSNGVKLKLNAEQGELGGIPTNRAMVTLKIRF
jgi:hypothetical protein